MLKRSGRDPAALDKRSLRVYLNDNIPEGRWNMEAYLKSRK